MKVLVFFLVTGGLAFLALWSQRPSSQPLSDRDLRASLSDTRSPGSLGSALTSISGGGQNPEGGRPAPRGPSGGSYGESGEVTAGMEPGARNEASTILAELSQTSPENLATVARTKLQALDADSYPLRLAIISQVDDSTRSNVVPGAADLVLSELDPAALSALPAPVGWKSAYINRLTTLYKRLAPDPEAAARLEERIAQQQDPLLSRIMSEARDSAGMGNPVMSNTPLDAAVPHETQESGPVSVDDTGGEFAPPPPVTEDPPTVLAE